jgi:heme/copper-type cytochrome/quinol oxidase subunit 2
MRLAASAKMIFCCQPARTAAIRLLVVTLIAMPLLSRRLVAQQPAERLIEVIADHDSRYKIPGQDKPVITVTASEAIRLRITAVKAKNHARDGSIHGFALLRASDHVPVPGWDLLLKPGAQEFSLTAPDEPGEYLVVCTVICSANHEQMTMKFIVEPRAK